MYASRREIPCVCVAFQIRRRRRQRPGWRGARAGGRGRRRGRRRPRVRGGGVGRAAARAGGAGVGAGDRAADVCEGCGQKIHDRFLMRVADGSWHEHCLACSECGVLLSRSCYCRNAKLYCKADYDRKFGAKCSRCGDRVLAQELVMRAQGLVFHLQCFACVVCCQPLQKGDQFVVHAGQLFCRPDFENKLYMLQASPAGEPNLAHCAAGCVRGRTRPYTWWEHERLQPRWFSLLCSQGTSCWTRTAAARRAARPKRPRTIRTSAQRRQFKASFEISPSPAARCARPSPRRRPERGAGAGVVPKQRAKMKKLQRKAKQEADQKSAGDRTKDGKEEKAIKQELRPQITPYPAHSGDSFCSSDISLDGSTNFEQLDEGGADSLALHNLDLPAAAPSDGLLPGLVQVNPIDKLYLMQNSYFSTEQ
ncbi:Protein apterous [Gryllus bimaculatus]|nr:Protein apterous [Gryllus bimaculatus]